MSARTETFQFDIGTKIIVKEIQSPGVVSLIRVTAVGRDYLVDYLEQRRSEIGMVIRMGS